MLEADSRPCWLMAWLVPCLPIPCLPVQWVYENEDTPQSLLDELNEELQQAYDFIADREAEASYQFQVCGLVCNAGIDACRPDPRCTASGVR